MTIEHEMFWKSFSKGVDNDHDRIFKIVLQIKDLIFSKIDFFIKKSYSLFVKLRNVNRNFISCLKIITKCPQINSGIVKNIRSFLSH